MRAFKRLDQRGFTLVELMIVVAIIGVLAALAIYGVNKYLATAKTAEAKNNIGAISRAAVAAYERETYQSEVLTTPGTSAAATHNLCGSSTLTPAAIPAAKKYQPSTAPGADFNNGDSFNGWTCLGFALTQPIYYALKYSATAGDLINATALGSSATFGAGGRG